MSFVSRVRSGDANQPTQRGFDRDEWSRAFADETNPSETDRALFDSGLLVDDQLRAIRAAIDSAYPYSLRRSERVRALIGAVNHQVLVAKDSLMDAMVKEGRGEPLIDPDGPFWLQGTASLAEFTQRINQSIENLVDGLRFPLSRAGAPPPQGWVRAEPSPLGVMQAINHAGFYNLLEHAWNDCLWRGWALKLTDMGVVLTQPGTEREALLAVGYFRQAMLHQEFSFYRLTTRQRAPRGLLPWDRAAPRHLELPLPSGERGVQLVDTRFGLEADEFGHAYDVFLLSEPYWTSLLETQLPRAGGVTVHEALLARGWVVALASRTRARFPVDHEAPDIDRLIEFAPVYEFKAMRRALAATLKIPESRAAGLLNLFIATGDHRDDLWRRPLVSVGSGQYTVLLAAATDSNPSRDAMGWINEGGADPEIRGLAFESFARAELAGMVNLPNASVYDDDLVFEAVGGSEQIDLVFVVGSKVVVCECRCIGVPTAAYEHHLLFERTLPEKAGQAIRKADFARRHAAAFLAAIGAEDVDPARAEFLPCVVSNLAIPSGQIVRGVPVVDLQVLGTFLGGGRFTSTSKWVRERGVEALEEIVIFPDSEVAADILPEYLREPVQLRRYLETVGWGITPLAWVSETVPPLLSETLTVHHPIASISPALDDTAETSSTSD